MEANFDQLINTFIAGQVGVVPRFLSLELSNSLQLHLGTVWEQGYFKTAGIGNESAAVHNKSIRSDSIYWLDRSHQNRSEDEFLDMIDAFVLFLNRTCYTGIMSYEFHFARYEEGSFYTRHLDQFKSDDSRKYTMIFYLNEAWKIQDGGELCIYHKDGAAQLIAPIGGTGVFFSSKELLHEVLVTQKPRMSITGWLKTN